MTTMVSARDPTISQPLEGIPLNQFAATLEHIRVRLARFEARLDERDCWAAAVRPPAQPPPEPDPPDAATLYTAYRRQFNPYPAPQPQPYLHHQPSCWYPPTQQLHTLPQNQSYTGGPTTYSVYELYRQSIPQPPDPAPSYGVPTYGLPGAQPQKQVLIQPADQPPYTGQPATDCCPLTGHPHSAAPLPAVVGQPYSGYPREVVVIPDAVAVVVPDEAVVVEEVDEKICSEVILFNRKSYDGDEMLMVVPPPLAAISLSCNLDIIGEDDALLGDFEENREGIRTMDDDNFIEDIPPPTDMPVIPIEEPGEAAEASDDSSIEEARAGVEWTEQGRPKRQSRINGLGKVFMFLSKPEEKTRRSQKLAQELVHKWSRLIFNKSPPFVSFYGNSKGSRSTIRCAFDPGGDSSLKLLFAMLFVGSWFPP